MAEYPPGTPCWVDLSSPDLEASSRFYGAVLGWDVDEVDDPERRYFTVAGRPVAGVTRGEQAAPAWTPYVSVADADATAARIAPAGGRLIAEPFDAREAGRAAVFSDVVGGVLGIWQPGRHPGAELVNRPGALCWNELQTQRRDEALDFYRETLGWEPVDVSAGGVEYWQWRAAGRPVAALLPVGADHPTRWVTCFVAEDADAVAARVEPNGGSLVTPPTDCPIGRYAEMHDPHGAFFQILRYGEQARAAAEQSAAEIGA